MSVEQMAERAYETWCHAQPRPDLQFPWLDLVADERLAWMGVVTAVLKMSE